MSACDELVGRPMYQVIRSQTIAPISPAKITAKVTARMSIIPEPIVFATAVPNPKAATKLKKAAQTTALPGRQHARGHDGGDRVRRVVEPVDVVEGERDRDEQDDDGQRIHDEPLAVPSEPLTTAPS